MSQALSHDHAVLLNQIGECLKSAKEAWFEAESLNIPDTKERMQRLYSDLIDMEQDFRIYKEVMANLADVQGYDSIIEETRRVQAQERPRKAAEKQERMAELFDHGEGRRGEEDEVTFAGGETTAGLLCPLTQKLPDNPIVSRLCRHVFERDAIMDYIRARAVGRVRGVTCPRAGCNALIGATDLYVDDHINSQIARARQEQDDEWEHV
jgi:SUMO ligase MMS21 Smc5/6 complex component